MSAESIGSNVVAERLLQVIDEGRRTATYKLALLLALLDACAANADDVGQAPRALHTRDVARHVLRIYLPQVRDYLGAAGDPTHLKQITNKNSAVLGAVLRLHLVAQASGLKRLDQIEVHLPEELERCLDTVEHTFARYPILLLQVIGNEHRPFLYDVDWTQSVSLSALHKEGGGLLRFRRGSGDHLLRLAPLLRPLIELHWVRMVASINRIDLESEHLRAHLFGSERTAFPLALRAGLRELQGGRCFYCGGRLGPKTEIDHFIPWSRWPNEAIENLVVADRCNNHKRDHLAAKDHLERWSAHLGSHASQLTHLAATTSWPSERSRTLATARTAYFHLPAGTPLWVRIGEFEEHDPERIAASLPT
jgi:hypothetical protein